MISQCMVVDFLFPQSTCMKPTKEHCKPNNEPTWPSTSLGFILNCQLCQDHLPSNRVFSLHKQTHVFYWKRLWCCKGCCGKFIVIYPGSNVLFLTIKQFSIEMLVNSITGWWSVLCPQQLHGRAWWSMHTCSCCAVLPGRTEINGSFFTISNSCYHLTISVNE